MDCQLIIDADLCGLSALDSNGGREPTIESSWTQLEWNTSDWYSFVELGQLVD